MYRLGLGWLVAALVVSVLSLWGCGPSEYPIVGSARAAGADGTVQVEDVEGGNHLVTVHMAHLPPPNRLGTGMTTYVVWFTGQGAQPVKAGTLDFDADAREGNMMATTPLKNFEIKVTAEQNAGVAAPSEYVVASRRVNTEE